MRIPLALLPALWLAACQTTSYEGNEASPYTLVPVGSTVTLTREITIPAENVAVYLQGGAVVPSGRVNQYYPHCKFELRTRRDTAQTVTPDEFAVVKVAREIGHSVAYDGVRLARVSIGIGVNIGLDGDGGSLQAYSTRLTLRSARQPDVFRLSCGLEALPHEGEHVSIADMRRALGGVFTLELAGRGKPPAGSARSVRPNA